MGSSLSVLFGCYSSSDTDEMLWYANADTSNLGSQEVAKRVGEEIAKSCLEKGIIKVAFDRGGYPYHGRIEALADAAREHGLQF